MTAIKETYPYQMSSLDDEIVVGYLQLQTRRKSANYCGFFQIKKTKESNGSKLGVQGSNFKRQKTNQSAYQHTAFDKKSSNEFHNVRLVASHKS